MPIKKQEVHTSPKSSNQSEMFWEKRVQRDFPSYTIDPFHTTSLSYREYYNMLSKVWNFYPMERYPYSGPFLIEPIDDNLQRHAKLSFLYPVPVFRLDGNVWFADVIVKVQKEGIIIAFIPRLSLLGPIPDVTLSIPKLNPKTLPASFQQVYEAIYRTYCQRDRNTNIFCLEHERWSMFLTQMKEMGYVRFMTGGSEAYEHLTLLEMLEDHELFHDPKMSEEEFAQSLILSNYHPYAPVQYGADFSYRAYAQMLAQTQILTNKLSELLLEPIEFEEEIITRDLALMYPVPLFEVGQDHRWLADIYIKVRGSRYIIGFRKRQSVIGPIPNVTNLAPTFDRTLVVLGYDQVFTAQEPEYFSFLVEAKKQGYYRFVTENKREPFAYSLDSEYIREHHQLFIVEK